MVNTGAEGGEKPDAPARPGARVRLDGVAELLDDARLDEAAQRRRQRRWREQRGRASLGMVDVLLHAVACRHHVTISTASGATATGTVDAVGADVVVLHTGSRQMWCSLDHLDAVEVERVAPGDPADRSELELEDLLERHPHEVELAVTTVGASVFRGTVLAVGDSLVLRCETPDREVALAIDRICLVSAPARS